MPEDVPVLEYAKEKDTSILNHYFTMGAYEKTVTVTDGSVTAVNFEGR